MNNNMKAPPLPPGPPPPPSTMYMNTYQHTYPMEMIDNYNTQYAQTMMDSSYDLYESYHSNLPIHSYNPQVGMSMLSDSSFQPPLPREIFNPPPPLPDQSFQPPLPKEIFSPPPPLPNEYQPPPPPINSNGMHDPYSSCGNDVETSTELSLGQTETMYDPFGDSASQETSFNKSNASSNDISKFDDKSSSRFKNIASNVLTTSEDDAAYSPTEADADNDEDEVNTSKSSHNNTDSAISSASSSQNNVNSYSDSSINANNKRKVVANVSKVKKRITIKAFQDSDNDEDEKEKNTAKLTVSSSITANDSISGISAAQLDIIKKTARWVVSNPTKLDALKANSINNSSMRFLFDKSDNAQVKQYLYEVNLAKREKEVQDVCSGVDLPVITEVSAVKIEAIVKSIAASLENNKPAVPAAVSTTVVDSSEVKKFSRKDRPNRWGPPNPASNDASAPPQPTVSESVSIKQENVSIKQESVTVKQEDDVVKLWKEHEIKSALSGADTRRFQALIEEQKQLQLIEQRIREVAKQGIVANEIVDPELDSISQLHQERLKQYNELAARDDDAMRRDTIDDAEVNNGIILGGSWEHRKRAKEMMKTADSSFELTLFAKGKHHISDFLPKEELGKFFKKVESVKGISTAATATAAGVLGVESFIKVEDIKDDSSIKSDNVGYQLLAKSGWEAGQGLGKDPTESKSIVTPISATGQSDSANKAGIGADTTSLYDVAETDDDFDEYRKRLMLAYRFRPNPLNNPRRNYY